MYSTVNDLAVVSFSSRAGRSLEFAINCSLLPFHFVNRFSQRLHILRPFTGKMFNPRNNLSAAEMLRWNQQMAAIFNDNIQEEDDRTDPSLFF